jgi:hypothetical protein
LIAVTRIDVPPESAVPAVIVTLPRALKESAEYIVSVAMAEVALPVPPLSVFVTTTV